MTAKEIREQNIEKMGEPLGTLYTALRNEVLWLHVVWRQYRVLFGTSESRYEFLNKAAGPFFGLLDDTLRESVFLNICRLTDKPVVAGKKTLTLRRLPGDIDDSTLAARVRLLVCEARIAAKFARDWRNRRIAHRDLELALSEGPQPLEPASRASVENVLTVFRDIVNAFESHYLKAEISFDHVSPPGDAEALLYQLRLARMVLDERSARLKAGEFRQEDFRQPPEI